MRSSNLARAILALSVFSQPLAQAQFVSSLPQCVQDCINQSQGDNCSITDIKCLCRASAGNFLPDLVTCTHGNCDNSLDNDLFLMPFQLVCQIAGTPIPDSAIHNAEDQASSLAATPTQVTTTVTMPVTYATTVAPYTTTMNGVSVSVTTTTVTQTESGTTLFLVYPITIDRTTTVSGAPSTYTSISTANPSNAFTESIPVVIISTDSSGSTYTSTTTELGAFSTYTTTDYQGSTVTQTSTFLAMVVQSPSSSPPQSSISGAKTTSLAAEKTSSSAKSTPKPSSASSSSNSNNGSPFGDSNDAPGRESVGNWLGLSVGLAVGIMWF